MLDWIGGYLAQNARPGKGRRRRRPGVKAVERDAERKPQQPCRPPGQQVQAVVRAVAMASSMILRMVLAQRPHRGLQPRQP